MCMTQCLSIVGEQTYKKDDLAICAFNILQQRRQSSLKLSPVGRPSHQRSYVQGDEPLASKAGRGSAYRNTMRGEASEPAHVSNRIISSCVCSGRPISDDLVEAG